MGSCSIIVNVRDKLSTTDRCLTTLLEQTPDDMPITAVLGGVPPELRQRWAEAYGHRVRFRFEDRFLTQAEARNIALADTDTELAVCMDNDVYVRPGWLEALLDCQAATDAVMVVPLILETERTIHTGGNFLYINYEGDVPYAHKYLPYYGLTFGDGSNLDRYKCDYGELHCQLVKVAPTLELAAYDPRIIEVGEVDSGLAWSSGGHEMWFEPTSVVVFDLFHPLEGVDSEVFAWRWNMERVLDGYKVFEEKWGIDVTEEGGFVRFLENYNSKLPLLPRLVPGDRAMKASRSLRSVRDLPRGAWRAARGALQRRAYRAAAWDELDDYTRTWSGGTRRPFTRKWAPATSGDAQVATTATLDGTNRPAARAGQPSGG